MNGDVEGYHGTAAGGRKAGCIYAPESSVAFSWHRFFSKRLPFQNSDGGDSQLADGDNSQHRFHYLDFNL